ncbi:crinkler effector domain-containing protein [Aspergillus ruber CBS 135680]|uniref:Crinkler effector protein N-terminal domain-containing protein n=1 Tax=Aspergillus ruber (strain CBS 135680) TaxID=1388766 RepID=A0A017S5M1_ASPRC|nr:uncharacterized protein EURHEDRAFT_244951 [Aspergillus ruber CBS 135680]EYE91450.1 hypothetical protein EURHEDRAFT_244951 [Aspergillus ruber CBS 135680]
MSRPRTRKLWCAVPGNLMQPFSIECVADQDDIETLMKKIWEEIKERIKDTAPHYSNLTLYSPVVQLNHEEEFRIDNGEFLHPRRMITSLFPESKDSDVDIVVVVSGDTTTRKQKRSEPQSANIHWTNPITENLLICPRERTVSKLAIILDEVNIVHVRGTPASGKTCLPELLRDHYLKEGRKVSLIKKWETLHYKNPWSSLIELVEKWNEGLEGAPITNSTMTSLQPEQDFSWVLTSNTVVLVDEAQVAYNDTALWNTITKEKRSLTCLYNFRLCLFCSYGSPRTGPDQTFFTPVTLFDGQRISLTPQNQSRSPNIGLFYDKEEFKDVDSRLLTYKYSERFTFDEDAQDYIFALTNGHPGVVESIVNVLFQVYRHDIKHRHNRTLTEDHVIWFLEDTATVFQNLSKESVNHSFPVIERCTSGISNILNTITEDGNILFDLNDADIRFCYQNGWIHRVALDGENIAVLPSRLHEK